MNFMNLLIVGKRVVLAAWLKKAVAEGGFY
jgi:hypothetical protein